MAKLTLNFPNMPDDAELEVVPYGLFKNNSTTEVEALESDLTLPAPTVPNEEALSEQTVPELRDLAKSTGVTIGDKNKDELIQAITEQEGIE